MKPLPQKLTIGMKLACAKYEHPEIVEIVKINNYERILLRRANGMTVRKTFSRLELAGWDYKLAEEV